MRPHAIRWLAILIGSVLILVFILLRQPTRSIDSNLSSEIVTKLNAEASKSRWSILRAQAWYASQPWLLGANYLPSTSVNVLEMWQDTFDEITIKRELKWANNRLRMNTLRVFLHTLVWMENSRKFFKRLDTFLDISKNNNLKIILVLFDECWNAEPLLGKQSEPIPGVHNSQWVRCPGQSMVLNKTSWPIIREYTIDVIDRYKSDERVLAWDLYNEPECSKQVNIILPLLHYIYAAARSVRNVQQPMTIGIAKWPLTTPLALFELSVSDIISFHSYGPLANVIQNITDLREVQLGRPILCTEWLARPFGSTLFTHLDYFKSEKIGAIQWGLIAGRSQTYYQWKSPKNAPMPRVWFHDVLYPNGTAFSQLEEQLYIEINH
ncbi:unnamed protein product [Rotaria sordida]|uniref:Glycoside hydrolase family 5 domain-containing protein n=1 Tax=Rotaria sordida TaxID=392033 RepID=A0A815CEX3_9BILA|nr:unnamed protein product [Rotaria sordida]CAF1279438.1 unnamed protein product [Rotaria sordida]CAF3618656.1 unnamed protein product [Rotaria sordida]